MDEKRKRNLKITELRKKKLTLSEIGKRFDVSPQRIFYIVKNTKRQMRQERKLAKRNGMLDTADN